VYCEVDEFEDTRHPSERAISSIDCHDRSSTATLRQDMHTLERSRKDGHPGDCRNNDGDSAIDHSDQPAADLRTILNESMVSALSNEDLDHARNLTCIDLASGGTSVRYSTTKSRCPRRQMPPSNDEQGNEKKISYKQQAYTTGNGAMLSGLCTISSESATTLVSSPIEWKRKDRRPRPGNP
jgi:hypothetical protein